MDFCPSVPCYFFLVSLPLCRIPPRLGLKSTKLLLVQFLLTKSLHRNVVGSIVVGESIAVEVGLDVKIVAEIVIVPEVGASKSVKNETFSSFQGIFTFQTVRV